MRVTVSDSQIRSAFEKVKHMAAFEESRALFATGQRPLEMIQAMCLHPEILRCFGEWGKGVYPGGLLERSIKEFIILEASRRNNCQFCRQSHIDFIRNMGIANDPLAAVTSPAATKRTEREKLAIEYTGLAMSGSNTIPDEFFTRLKKNFTDPEIVEMTFTIGMINLLNLFNNCLQVTYHGECALAAEIGKKTANAQSV
jgi:AhpD family alkylhydroperoxidase